jgi:5,10-methylenetetrahydromethanopterin reductase
MRFSCQLLPEQPLDELLDLIALADELGFDACYSADETYHKDMWTLFAAAAADHVRTGRRSREGDFDFCASILGAIAIDGDAAKEGARVAAAFYISSMPPELVERHGIPFEDVRPVVDAFAKGDVDGALELVPRELGERLSLAGTPGEWISRIRRDFEANGYNHMALGLADPFLVESWSGVSVRGLPTLAEQLRLVHDEVFPALASSSS